MKYRFFLLLAAAFFCLALASQSNPQPDKVPIVAAPSRLTGTQVLALIGAILIVVVAILSPFLVPALSLGLNPGSSDLSSSCYGLAHYQPFLQQMAQPRELIMVELRAKHEASPPIYHVNDVQKRYPALKMLQQHPSRLSWLSQVGEHKFVVKLLPMSDFARTEIEHELRIMRLLAGKPHASLRRPLHVFYGEITSIVINEWIEGKAWNSMQVSVEENVWIIMQIADALEHLHSQLGLNHGDVHGGNVIIDRRGRAHLIDFGRSQARGCACLGSEPHLDIKNLAETGRKLLNPHIIPEWLHDILTGMETEKFTSAGQVGQALRSHLPKARRFRANLTQRLAEDN